MAPPIFSFCQFCGKKFKYRSNKKFCCENHKNYFKVKKRRIKKIKYFLDYKKNKKCVFCGWNKFPSVLQFHHLKRGSKDREVSYLIYYPTNNLKEIYKEIEKCILLCPNFHFTLHFKELSINNLLEREKKK